MKLHKIAYSHDLDNDEYVVFKGCGKQDFALATFRTSVDAEDWIKSKYIALGKIEGYDLCHPFTFCDEKPTTT